MAKPETRRPESARMTADAARATPSELQEHG